MEMWSYDNAIKAIILIVFLRVFQKDDLKAVVDYLRSDGNVSMIGLWGRSMGAVTRFSCALSFFTSQVLYPFKL